MLSLAYCSLLAYHQTRLSYNDLDVIPKGQADYNNEVETVISDSDKEISDVRDNITLNDIFISVKTTRNYEDTRLPVILKTWFQLAKEQVSICCKF